MHSYTPKQIKDITEYLSQFISENKKNKIEIILRDRTKYLTVLLENIYQPHNASAAIRSCECFGIQDLHIIEKDNDFKPNTAVAQGSAKWVDLMRHTYTNPNSLKSCISRLKDSGYKIIATTLRGDSKPIDSLSLDQKTVLCFGNELNGLSNEMHSLADGFVHIPMQGFTQSLNLSVSVSLCLYNLTRRLRHSLTCWQLSKKEQADLRLKWYIKSVSHGDLHLKKFLKDYG